MRSDSTDNELDNGIGSCSCFRMCFFFPWLFDDVNQIRQIRRLFSSTKKKIVFTELIKCTINWARFWSQSARCGIDYFTICYPMHVPNVHTPRERDSKIIITHLIRSISMKKHFNCWQTFTTYNRTACAIQTETNLLNKQINFETKQMNSIRESESDAINANNRIKTKIY